MEKKYTVYMHIFPNDKRYIGITSKSVEKRWGVNGSGYRKQGIVGDAIRKYGWQNIQHVILHTDLNEYDAKELERYYITQVYHSNNSERGYNLTDGGDGTVGLSLPDWQRKLLSEYAHKRTGEKNPFYGKHHTDETKRKVSEAKKRQNLRGKGTHNSKPVLCIETGQIFESASLAADWVGASNSTITNACRHGSDFLSYGYHWQYITQ